MALPKQVKIGGSYYEGGKLAVSATPGDYNLDMSHTAAGVINGMTIVTSKFADGDTFSVEHYNASTELQTVLVKDMYNIGNNSAWYFDFSSLEKMLPNDILRLAYTNSAGTAMSVYAAIEWIR